MKPLAGKVALITGGSRGIGSAAARALAGAGAWLYLVADAMEDELACVAADCARQGGRAEYGLFDLAEPDGAQRMVDAALGSFGRVDILVNNAGIRIRHPFGEFSCAEFDRLIAVNLRAPFLASQAVLPAMRAHGGGRIINVASQMGMVASANSALYGIAKAGLIHLTKAMAVDLAADNIMVNAVSPGPILTEFTRAQMAVVPDYCEQRAARVPLGRWGTPEEVAETILFLAATPATFMHGSNVVIDGGYIAQ